MKCIRDRWADIRDKATLLGVSGGSPESHLKFIKKQNLPFPLIYDEEGKVAETYGVRSQHSVFGLKVSMIKRVTFIIDEAGQIEHVLEKVNLRNHAEDLLELLS